MVWGFESLKGLRDRGDEGLPGSLDTVAQMGRAALAGHVVGSSPTSIHARGDPRDSGTPWKQDACPEVTEGYEDHQGHGSPIPPTLGKGEPTSL